MLGCNVVEVLHERGFEIVALVRRSNGLLDRYCDVVFGKVDNYDTLRDAAIGCDAILHIAAVTDPSLRSLGDYRFNWEVAENVGNVANEIGIKKVIFVSSANSIGNGTLQSPAKETTELKWPYKKSLYGQSKVIAEARLKSLFPEAIIFNPTFMIGMYDSKPSSGTIIEMGYKKRFVFVPRGGKNFVPAIDVANAIGNALTDPNAKGNYIAGGVEMTSKQFMKMIAEIYSYKTTTIVLPNWMIKIGGWVGDILRLCGFKVAFSSTNMGILTQREFYSSAKAENELLYKVSDIKVAIKNATDWMLNNGNLRHN